MELTYGEYGGRFVPETLIPALDELEAGWREAWADPRTAPSWTSSAAPTPAGRRRSRSRSASRPGKRV